MVGMIGFVQKNAAFHASDEEVCETMHIGRDSDIFRRAAELKNEVKRIIRPAFIMKRVPVEGVTSGGILIAGEHFHSPIAASKAGQQKSVVVFIVTCGREIGDYLRSVDDALDSYIVDQLAQIGCRNAEEEMLKTLPEKFNIERFIRLSPGSIIDWDVEEVKKFFTITDGLHQQLGIRVLDSGLIDPLKSISGLIVESAEEFESCDICMRPDCPSRKSRFDPDKYDEMVNL